MKKIILLFFGLFNLVFSSAAQDEDCRVKIKKLRQAYGEQISHILSDKNKTEKLLEGYRSGKLKPPGMTATTPPNPSVGPDKDYIDWRGKYYTEKTKSAEERSKRKKSENDYNELVKEKGNNDLVFLNVVKDKDRQILTFRDTITVKEKQIDKKNETIQRQRDTIWETREIIKETTEHYRLTSLQVFALYDAKGEKPFPILLSNKEMWPSENKGLSREGIKQLIVTAEALRSDKSQSVPCVLSLYKKVGETSSEKVKDVEHEFKRDKQVGNLTLYTLKFNEDEFIWDYNGKNFFGKKKRKSIFKSDAKYEIRIKLNNKEEYRSVFFLID